MWTKGRSKKTTSQPESEAFSEVLPITEEWSPSWPQNWWKETTYTDRDRPQSRTNLPENAEVTRQLVDRFRTRPDSEERMANESSDKKYTYSRKSNNGPRSCAGSVSVKNIEIQYPTEEQYELKSNTVENVLWKKVPYQYHSEKLDKISEKEELIEKVQAVHGRRTEDLSIESFILFDFLGKTFGPSSNIDGVVIQMNNQPKILHLSCRNFQKGGRSPTFSVKRYKDI